MDIPTVEQALEANGLYEQAAIYRSKNSDAAIRAGILSHINNMWNCELGNSINTLIGLWAIAATITIGFGAYMQLVR